MADLTQLFPGGFDHAAVEPDEGRDFSPLPAGAYEVEITNSEVKDAKSGKGCYLSLEFTVINPQQYASRKVWANITLKNASAQAESIGQAQLSSLCRATGLPAPLRDSDHLFQKIVRIRVKIEPAKDNYPAKNEVTGYESLGQPASAPAQRQAAATPAARPAAAPRAAATPPWAKK